jgi:phosphoserine phosphatase RsbU/P
LTHLAANGKVVLRGDFSQWGATAVRFRQPPSGSPSAKVFVMATLEVCTESDGSKYFELTADETVVGRDQFCDVVLNNHTVSRRHARIVRTAEGYFIEDLASLNGTYLNSRKLEGRTPIKNKDRIHIYEVVTIFHDASPEEVRTSGDTVLAPGVKSEHTRVERVDEIPGPVQAVGHASPQPAVAEVDADAGSQARFRAALKISLSLEGETDVDEILPKVVDSLFEMFPQAVRGYVLLAEGADGHLVPRAIKHRQSESGQSMTFGPISRKTALHVMSTGKAVLMDDTPDGVPADASQSVFDIRCLSMICAPLIGPSQRPLGIVYLDATDPQHRFNEEDLDVLVAVATVAGGRVESVGQRGVSRDTTGHQRQLGTAKEVQQQFLPQRRPEVAGYQFYHHYQAADEVGGDYFGYIPMSEGRLALAIGDVAGKGVGAALLMAHFCSEVRYCLATSSTPAEAVARLNQDLSSETLNYHFVTFALCVLDPKSHRLTIVNAGHLPPLLRRGRSVEQIGTVESGLPLGCDADRKYEQIELQLNPGDAIVLHTDGISDAMNATGEVYGTKRVRELITRGPIHMGRLGEALLDDMRRFVGGRLPSDDVCLVCFSRQA